MYLLAVLLSSFVFLAACEKQKEKPTLNPSAANEQIFDSIMTLVGQGRITTEAQFNAVRNKLSASIIGKVRSDSLQGESLFEYAQLLYWSGDEHKGREILEDLRESKGSEASEAWKQLITMEIEGNRYARAEAMMKEYRAAFPPDTSDLQYLFNESSTLADRYNDANEPEAAIRVYTDELTALLNNGRHGLFCLMSGLASVMMETGRIDDCRAFIEKCSAKMQAELALSQKNPRDSTAADANEIVTGLRDQIGALTALSSQLGLIGTKAPDFKFLHVYNADSNLTLERMRGRIVMLDFWTTWCVPCAIGYEEARHIYHDYKSKGLEIIGITSLQGTYKDSEVSEGTKEKPLDKKREIDLIESYVKKHKIVWPCAISDRSIFECAYKIKAVPTFVLLDRNGIIRFIQSGIAQEKQKRRVIDKLIRG